MFCNACGGTVPFEEGYSAVESCVFCSGNQVVDHTDLLSNTGFGLVHEHRDAQIELTKIIGKGIAQKHPVVVEAGTGVGKSFAYLLPSILYAVLAKRTKANPDTPRIIITTAKKSLQDQLIKKDLPYLQTKLSALKHPGAIFKFEPYYGRGNHACKRQVHKILKLKQIKDWDDNFFAKTDDWLWENSPDKRKFYPRADLNAENCVGSKCEFSATCAYVDARKRASEANIVVTNHWLVGFHLRFAEEDEGVRLLGDFRYLIVDEAHKLEEGIRAAYTVELSEATMNKLLMLCDAVDEETSVISGARSLTHDVDPDVLRNDWSGLFNQVRVGQKNVDKVLAGSFNKLDKQLGKIEQNVKSTAGLISTASIRSIAAGILAKVIDALTDIKDALAHSQDSSIYYVSYVEKRGSKCVICVAPVSVKPQLQALHNDTSSVAHTSATLAVNGSLDTFKNRVGLGKVSTLQTAQYGSAFNLDRQAILYLSKNIPKPAYQGEGREAYISAVADDVDALLEANQGNAFVLFTSKADMADVYGRISHKHSIISQAQMSAPQALTKFRTTDNSSLFGLKSFWEGVDVQGDKLSLVIVTKLPFPPPDPIVEARRNAAGDRAFHTVDLPDMILDLRQGIGRLIRSKKDRGVIALLDPRVLTNRYGKTILRSIGIKKPTTNRDAVVAQLQNLVKHRK